MGRESKRKNCSCKRVWNAFGIIGVITVVFVICTVFSVLLGYIGEWVSAGSLLQWQAVNSRLASDTAQDWICKNGELLRGASGIGIVAIETSDYCEIKLTDRRRKGSNYEQISGEKLQISGRKDMEHGYFEGKIAWSGQEICILNFDSGEYAVLREDIRSFMIGDYYVSCKCDEEMKEMELLIFFCPA